MGVGGVVVFITTPYVGVVGYNAFYGSFSPRTPPHASKIELFPGPTAVVSVYLFSILVVSVHYHYTLFPFLPLPLLSFLACRR